MKNLEVEERLMRLELAVERMTVGHLSLTRDVIENTERLKLILSNTESLDKILKYVVTPLIAVIGALMGIGVVFPT